MTTQNSLDEEEDAMLHSFNGLPLEQERKNMSVIQLAEILADCKEKSLPQIVISHELNLKIAKEQAKATITAGWLGLSGNILAVIFTFLLGYFIGTSHPQEACQNITSRDCGRNSNKTLAVREPPAVTANIQDQSISNQAGKKNENSKK